MILEFSVVTALQRDAYDQLNVRLQAAGVPDFLEHDRCVAKYWSQLAEVFPDYQFILVDTMSGEPVGRGHSIPLEFNNPWSSLPDGGFDWVIEKGFRDLRAGNRPTVLSALFIVISEHHLGKGFSYRMLAAMREIGRRHGFSELIAPVRPSLKDRYPLIPFEEYCRWQSADGFPFDPWLRVHIRAGGEALQICPESMVVNESIHQWSMWTGSDYPGDGQYTVPGGLVPITVDHDVDRASYIEPGIWILHKSPIGSPEDN